MSPRVAVFAFDRAEASQARAIRGMIAAGAQVESLSFRRPNGAADAAVTWPDTDLGPAPNGVGPGRMLAVARGAARAAARGGALRRADVLVARNLDMALVALAARRAAGSRAPLIYECRDIHALMLRAGPAGAAARAAERGVVARAARLVVSAPAFVAAYFRPLQGWHGPAFLMENRIDWAGAPAPRPAAAGVPGPVTLGWVGTLRCPATLDLLAATAAAMGPRGRVVLRGRVHRHQLPDFDAVLARHPNMDWQGPYSWPGGLACAYAGLDAVWAQDMWQPGGNSDWLLPNRIYEAGYFGCPAIAVAGTETAARVAAEGLGPVLPAPPCPRVLAALLLEGRARLAEVRAGLLARPASAFCTAPWEVAAMLDLSRPPEGRNRIAPRAAA